jgi:hypothetical protein
MNEIMNKKIGINSKHFGLCKKKDGRWDSFWPQEGIEWIQYYIDQNIDANALTMEVIYRPDPKKDDIYKTFSDIAESEYYVMSVLLPMLIENARRNDVQVNLRTQVYNRKVKQPTVESYFILNYSKELTKE